MAGRKPIPDQFNKNDDVMAALQGVKTKPLTPDVDKQETPVIEPPEAKAVPPASAKAEVIEREMERKAASNVKKTKVNLYLDAEIKRRIEQAQLDLRKIADPDKAGQINYSLIVETALEIVFDEFDRRAQVSALSQEIMKRLQTK